MLRVGGEEGVFDYTQRFAYRNENRSITEWAIRSLLINKIKVEKGPCRLCSWSYSRVVRSRDFILEGLGVLQYFDKSSNFPSTVPLLSICIEAKDQFRLR